MDENLSNLFCEIAKDENFGEYTKIRDAAEKLWHLLNLFDINVKQAHLLLLENQNQRLKIELGNLLLRQK